MVNPLIPVILVFVIYTIAETLKKGMGIVLLFVYTTFLFATFDVLSSTSIFYLIIILGALIIPLLFSDVVSVTDQDKEPTLFGNSATFLFPLVSVLLGVGTIYLLRVLSGVGVTGTIFPTPSLSFLNAGDFSGSLIASIGIIEQKYMYVLKDVLKLLIEPITMFITLIINIIPFIGGILAPISAGFLLHPIVQLGTAIGLTAVVFAVFHIKAFGITGALFANSLIIFAILAQVLWLTIQEFAKNGFIGETGHFGHNATVSLQKSLTIAG